jgi:hypothetical protein
MGDDKRGGIIKKIRGMFEDESAMPWATFTMTVFNFYRDTWGFWREDIVFWRENIGFCLGK